MQTAYALGIEGGSLVHYSSSLGNADRHHYETLQEDDTGMPLHLDNAKR